MTTLAQLAWPGGGTAILAAAAMCALLAAQIWFGATPRVDRRPFVPFLDEFPEWWEFFTWRDESPPLFWLGIGLQTVVMSILWSIWFLWA